MSVMKTMTELSVLLQCAPSWILRAKSIHKSMNKSTLDKEKNPEHLTSSTYSIFPSYSEPDPTKIWAFE